MMLLPVRRKDNIYQRYWFKNPQIINKQVITSKEEILKQIEEQNKKEIEEDWDDYKKSIEATPEAMEEIKEQFKEQELKRLFTRDGTSVKKEIEDKFIRQLRLEKKPEVKKEEKKEEKEEPKIEKEIEEKTGKEIKAMTKREIGFMRDLATGAHKLIQENIEMEERQKKLEKEITSLEQKRRKTDYERIQSLQKRMAKIKEDLKSKIPVQDTEGLSIYELKKQVKYAQDKASLEKMKQEPEKLAKLTQQRKEAAERQYQKEKEKRKQKPKEGLDLPHITEEKEEE